MKTFFHNVITQVAFLLPHTALTLPYRGRRRAPGRRRPAITTYNRPPLSLFISSFDPVELFECEHVKVQSCKSCRVAEDAARYGAGAARAARTYRQHLK
ncbi:hypothetical protein EVAR_46850_1 [Eumeta japonica]|uniref:Uncharacterized protein n=1 Tax=Eumeta variegata TaxID=151549 RepID=A0A4C1XMA9_EUMVA|nr:hypothetical protein EVAR_46850_1 [Eumeta japonica]